MTDAKIEKLILTGLVTDFEFVKSTIPYIQEEYFHDKNERIVFKKIKDYLNEYNTLPNKLILTIDINNSDNLNVKEAQACNEIIEDVFSIDISEVDKKWLLNQTEKFCQDKAVYNAIMKAISIYDGSDKTSTPHVIPDMIRDAISINFDTEIGQDFFDNAEERFQYYTNPENKIPFDIDVLNKVTNNGVLKKTLNLIVAGINVGKTMTLCHLAAAYMKMGYNVLYISMEMSEHEILKRIDSNILKININHLNRLNRDEYFGRLEKIKQKTYGKIKVKQFPTGTASAAHFSHIINELKNKKRFIPDIILVDYLGICASSRLKPGMHNTYVYLKAISEELRALSIETNTVLWTAMQLNRNGIGTNDVEITDISDSMGVPASADLIFSVSRTEELDALNQLLFKQLKSRYANKTNLLRFVVGVDFEKQTLYDVNQSEQEELVNETATNTEIIKSERKSKLNLEGLKI